MQEIPKSKNFNNTIGQSETIYINGTKKTTDIPQKIIFNIFMSMILITFYNK